MGEHGLTPDHRDGVITPLTIAPCEQPAPHLTLSNPNASEGARKLLPHLSSIYGKKVITDRHTKDIPMGEVEYIRSVTGDKPALCGFELLDYSPNIQRETSDESTVEKPRNNPSTIPCAIRWEEEAHGIVARCQHWLPPMRGSGKALCTEHVDFDCAKAVTPGSPECEAEDG